MLIDGLMAYRRVSELTARSDTVGVGVEKISCMVRAGVTIKNVSSSAPEVT